MNKINIQLIDSVSASELIKALHTLQHLSQKQISSQISFCKLQQPQNIKQFANSKAVHYQNYKAIQQQKHTPQKPISRKSISPLKQRQQDNNLSKVSNLKSRSHSPLQKKTARAETSRNKHSKLTPKKVGKQNKKKQQVSTKDYVYPSFQSKKILQQKHRQGINYIPIQHRAEYLLKQKQIKLSKLQKEKEISKIMEEKECTFRPNITKNLKKVNIVQKEYHQPVITIQEMKKFDQCFITEQFLCPPIQPFIKEEQSVNSQFQVLKRKGSSATQNDETQLISKKFKNQMFSHILDPIH